MGIGIGGAMFGGSLFSGYQGKRTADKSRRSANKQYRQTRADLEPYREAGSNALNAYTDRLGINPGFTPLGYDEWSAQNPAGGYERVSNEDGFSGNVWNPNLNPGGQAGYQNYLKANPATEAGQGPSYNTDLPQYQAADYQRGGDFDFNLQADPGYQFALQEAMNQANRGMASQGGFNSGNRLAALTDRAAGVASQYANDAFNRQFATSKENFGRGLTDYGIRDERAKNAFNVASGQEKDLYGREQNYLTRLGNLAGSGQNAAAQMGAFGAQNVANQTQANMFGANSMNNAVQGGISNYLMYDYLNNPPTRPSIGANSWTDSNGYGVG